MASTASSRGRQNGGTLKQAFETLREGVEGMGEDVIALADAVKEEAHTRAESAGRVAQRRGVEVYEEARSHVGERPMAALGIAAGVGLLLGMVLMGRRR